MCQKCSIIFLNYLYLKTQVSLPVVALFVFVDGAGIDPDAQFVAFGNHRCLAPVFRDGVLTSRGFVFGQRPSPTATAVEAIPPTKDRLVNSLFPIVFALSLVIVVSDILHLPAYVYVPGTFGGLGEV